MRPTENYSILATQSGPTTLLTVAPSGVLTDNSGRHADRDPYGIPNPESEIRRLWSARQSDAPVDTGGESGKSIASYSTKNCRLLGNDNFLGRTLSTQAVPTTLSSLAVRQ